MAEISIDCGEVNIAVDEVTGLDHLEGQTVAILANGEVLDQQEVSGGKITLDKKYSKVKVGLPYYADLETLNIEIQSDEGTLQGRKVKIGNVIFRVVNTRGGWVGPNEDILKEAFINASDDETELVTDDIRVNLGAGYEDGGRIFYRQKDPLPVTITAVIPEVTPGGISG
jgi:hypothetical protein